MSRSSSGRNISILNKLYHREMTGRFVRNVVSSDNKAKLLFGYIPARLQFNMKSVIKNLGMHVFMGTSMCGAFLITYSFTFEPALVEFTHEPSHFKYKLHFWLYSPGNYAVLVDELILFQGYDIQDALTVKFAQWPSLTNKILVCGQSYSGGDADHGIETYITITSLPPRSKCTDCRLAKSLSTSELSSIERRCLKHGLTLHTMVNIVSPFPPINMTVALKDENCFVINGGNFIHVLSVDLIETGKNNFRTTNQNDDLSTQLKHNIGIDLIPWGYKVPATNNQYFNNAINHILYQKVSKRKLRDSNENAENNVKPDHCIAKKAKYQPKPLPLSKQAQLKQIANKVYDFADTEDGCNLKFKWFRRRTIADKMYEYCSDDDEDMENIHPNENDPIASSKPTCLVSTESNNKNCIEKILCDIAGKEEHEESKLSKLESSSNLNSTEKNILIKKIKNSTNDMGVNIIDSESRKSTFKSNCSILSPLSISCDNIYFNYSQESSSIGDYETASLSPRSDISYSTVSSECSEHWWKLDVTDPFISVASEPSNEEFAIACGAGNKFPKLHLKKFFLGKSHVKSGLKPRNPDVNNMVLSLLRISEKCTKCYTKPAGERSRTTSSKGNKYIRQNIAGCSVNFEHFYTEYGNINYSDISVDALLGYDDNEPSEFQGELPLLVLGASASQMKLTSRNEVHHLKVPYCSVKQDTLDIEQFCYKAAEIICKCEGYKFWFCCDYDVEIVDICSLNGDILAVVFMRINAELETPQNGDQPSIRDSSRQFYELHCIFTWNARSNKCWLEAYYPLAEACDVQNNWNPAKDAAPKLKFLKLGFFSVPLMKPIRHYEHHINEYMKFGPSLKVIEDEYNLLGFHRDKFIPNRDDVQDDIPDGNGEADYDSYDSDEDSEHRDPRFSIFI